MRNALALPLRFLLVLRRLPLCFSRTSSSFYPTPVFLPLSAGHGGSLPFAGNNGVESDLKSSAGSGSDLVTGLKIWFWEGRGGGWTFSRDGGWRRKHQRRSWGCFRRRIHGQLESSEGGGYVGGGADCFSWPGLAISTPGRGLK
ncbi:hypothetical protein K1719_047510 [Acacia pycnantha]|nr:hypothetical protein K1719_047510 [Acacia pycnantha]